MKKILLMGLIIIMLPLIVVNWTVNAVRDITEKEDVTYE